MNDSMKSLNDAGESSERKTLTPEERIARQKAAMKKWREKNPGYQKARRDEIRAGKRVVKHRAITPSTEAQSSPVEAPVQPEGHEQHAPQSV